MIRPWRRLLQAGSLLVLVAIPLLSRYLAFGGLEGGYQGIFVLGFSVVSPLEGTEVLLATRELSPPLLLALAVPVLTAVLLGRVFCSFVCPVNTLQEVTDAVAGLRAPGPRRDRIRLPKRTLFLVLAADLALVAALGAPFFAPWSPPGLVGRELLELLFFGTATAGLSLLGLVLVLNLLTRRFFCRYLCPLGGLLAVLALRRRLRVSFDRTRCTDCGRCAPVCPLGLDPAAGESEGPYCTSCAECRDVCETGSLGFRLGRRGPAGERAWAGCTSSATGTRGRPRSSRSSWRS